MNDRLASNMAQGGVAVAGGGLSGRSLVNGFWGHRRSVFPETRMVSAPSVFGASCVVAVAVPVVCSLFEYGTRHYGKRWRQQLAHFSMATCDVDVLIVVVCCQVRPVIRPSPASP